MESDSATLTYRSHGLPICCKMSPPLPAFSWYQALQVVLILFIFLWRSNAHSVRSQRHTFDLRGSVFDPPVGAAEAGERLLVDNMDTFAGKPALTDQSPVPGCARVWTKHAVPLD
jgi:hypothetical protein